MAVVINSTTFNSLANSVHTEENAKWWVNEDGMTIHNHDDRLLLLVISEIIEAMEGDRKNLMDDKLTHRKQVEVELADAVLRLLDRMEGIKLKKFRNIYKYKKTFENQDITIGLYHIVKMLTDPVLKYETELVVHNILDLGYANGYDVFDAVNEKRIYNKSRSDHSYTERNTENGKKY